MPPNALSSVSRITDNQWIPLALVNQDKEF
jgi:hypothetical protein